MPSQNINSKNKFSSRIGFLAAAASSAVGVGNIWRFPYTVGKYGGAGFLLLYILFVCILGFPLVLAKLAFGRKMQAGTYKAYSKLNSKKWMYVGLGAAIVSFIILSFYNMITGWLIGYFFNLVNGTLLNISDFDSAFVSFVGNIKLNLILTIIVTILIAGIVKSGISEGIERISKILMPLFIFMLIGLIIYALTLEGSVKGLKFYLIPSWDSITPQAMYAALTQSFLSLSIGSGISITYGAYVSKKDNLVKSSAIIVISDTLISFLAGLIIFPIIFHKGISPTQGPSLIFISLPLAFKGLGSFIGTIVGGTFFLLLVFAAVTSAISLLEVVVRYLIERFDISRNKAVYSSSFIIFLISIPSILSFSDINLFKNIKINNNVTYSFFDIIGELSMDVFMPAVGLLFSLFVIYKWKLKSLKEEIANGYNNNKWLDYYLKISIKYLAPILITIAIILKLLEFWTGNTIT